MVVEDLQHAMRPSFGAVITSLFGISPPNLKWSVTHSKVVSDYLWAIGNTPFGYFSRTFNISFSHRDSAAKNIIHSEINDVLVEVNSLFHHFTVRFLIQFILKAEFNN